MKGVKKYEVTLNNQKTESVQADTLSIEDNVLIFRRSNANKTISKPEIYKAYNEWNTVERL